LPIHPLLSEEDKNIIINVFKSAIKKFL